MNNDNLDIVEIREKCNAAIDYLKVEVKKISDDIKQSNDEWCRNNQDIVNKTNPDFFAKISYAIKFGLNIFAATVLGIDREFLDFSTYKSNKSKSNNNFLIALYSYVDVLNGAVLTLDNIKNKINFDNSLLIYIYRELNKINDYNFWHVFFNMLEKSSVDVKYSVDKRKILFNAEESKSFTPNRIIENGLYGILNNNNLTKTAKTR